MGRALAIALLAAWSAACSTGERFPSPPAEILSSAEAIRAGEALYRKDCQICHGPAGHGNGPQAKSLSPSPADLVNLSGPRSDRGYWFLRIKEGKQAPLARPGSAMPSWGQHLSDEQIWQLVAFLNALAGGPT